MSGSNQGASADADRAVVNGASSESPPQAASIPSAIMKAVLAMGRAEWGATAEQVAAAHIEDFTETLRKTREHFNCEDVPVALHGLYLEGTETVLCHTGTSPNSGVNAQALTGAWNWLHDQCVAQGMSAEGENSRSEVEGEARQPGGDSHAPNSHPNTQGGTHV